MDGLTSGMDNRRRYRTLRKGLKEKLAQGYMMSRCPYGYRITVKVQGTKVIKLPREPDPETAPVVRRMFEMYRNGGSYLRFARELNRCGIPSPNGKSWTNAAVGSVIWNPVYCGKVRTNRYAYFLGRKKRVWNRPEKWNTNQSYPRSFGAKCRAYGAAGKR